MKVDIVEIYKEKVRQTPDMSVPVSAISALTQVIQFSEATTMIEFTKELDYATSALQLATEKCVAITAGCELFLRFVTRTGFDTTEDFSTFKARLVERGEHFVQRAFQCREKIASMALEFIQDGARIMIHSCSRVVMALLLRAAATNRRFTVLVTEAKPTSNGYKAAKILRQHGIPTTVILDTAMAYFMESVDLVLTGGEGVVENGGIINQIGTYLMAVVAKAANVPFYAVVESYKFVRYFPLSQYDMPSNVSGEFLFCENRSRLQEANNGTSTGNGADQSPPILNAIDSPHPAVDYTPPSYITLLFTDLGILTPSSVSDELIKLYY